MTVDFRATFRSACAATMILAISTVAYAENEDESYYLSQMRENSQTQQNQPALETPANDKNLLAETDLKELAKASEEMEKVDDLRPQISKPSLPSLKPEL